MEKEVKKVKVDLDALNDLSYKDINILCTQYTNKFMDECRRLVTIQDRIDELENTNIPKIFITKAEDAFAKTMDDTLKTAYILKCIVSNIRYRKSKGELSPEEKLLKAIFGDDYDCKNNCKGDKDGDK